MNSQPELGPGHGVPSARLVTRGVQVGLMMLGCLGLFLGATASRVQALTMYDIEVVCPIDGNTFLAKAIGIYRQTGMRLDSKPLGSLMAPTPYPVCPGNGFVVYKNDFSDEELATLRSMVLAEDYQRARKDHTDRYMVAFMRERMGANGHELGFLYLEASWEAESENSRLVNQYRSLSLEKFDAFLAEDNSRSDQWWAAAAAAAELERMLGNFDAVEKRLSALPVADLFTGSVQNGSVLMSVISQIRFHAKNHNSAPEAFVEEPKEQVLGE
jgi:hypothetical protein